MCVHSRDKTIDIVCSNEITSKQFEPIKVDTASLTKCKSHSFPRSHQKAGNKQGKNRFPTGSETTFVCVNEADDYSVTD